ncbi:hypothetical protein C8R45DRAFT_1111806 [Mycena sanguinolenta]|nr:hypothetical protein C8R45DRAFT_1111806 [Mycena sanguinolenta]
MSFFLPPNRPVFLAPRRLPPSASLHPQPRVWRRARSVRLVYTIPLALCAVGASRRIVSTFLLRFLPLSTPASAVSRRRSSALSNCIGSSPSLALAGCARGGEPYTLPILVLPLSCPVLTVPVVLSPLRYCDGVLRLALVGECTCAGLRVVDFPAPLVPLATATYSGLAPAPSFSSPLPPLIFVPSAV